MIVTDIINKTELEMTREEMIEVMVKSDRQVDLYFDYEKNDCPESPEFAYLKWNHENWTTVDGKRFICSYFVDERALSDYGAYNVSDIGNYFMPEEAKKIVLG